MNDFALVKQFTTQLTDTYLNQVCQLDKIRQDFIANVSHELRTPLTVLHGYLETWLDNPSETIESAVVQQMYQQSTRMAHLIDGLLLLAKLEEPEVDVSQHSPVHVAKLLAHICKEAMVVSPNVHHDIVTDIDCELSILGNTGELQSAFSNLIFNAVKYTPHQGRIHVRWYKTALGAIFSVQDTGIGIEAKHIPRLTERFYRVDKARSRDSGGTGLGLAIVKHVLARHQGELFIDSTPGEGSIFECRFEMGALA